jgi:PAS domain S-box-containing protein
MSRAIEIWTEGDRHIDELRAAADALRKAVQSGADAAALLPIRDRIHDIDDRLTPLEERFSATLGEAARATYHLLVGTVVFGAALLASVSIAFSHRVARHEREQSESLRESEARFHRAMVGSSDGFWEWDLIGDRAYYSPQFEKLLGMPPGTLPPRIAAVKRLLHVDDIELARAALSAHLKRGEPYDLVMRLRSADGPVALDASARPVAARRRRRGVRMSGSIVDVTDRRHAEQALRESEALFRSLWETTDDAVLIIGADHLIRFANPAAHGLFGHARESLRGKPIALIEPHPSRSRSTVRPSSA